MPGSKPQVLVEGIGKPAGTAPGVGAFVTTRGLGSMKDPAARQKALETVGLGGRPLFLLKQVHGTEIVSAGERLPAAVPEADGWISDKAGVVLGVFIADCVPLFLWDKGGRAIGVFHAGWRGMAAGMPARAVEAFEKRLGIPAVELHAAIGPHIRSCCFQVGPDTAGQFAPKSRLERDGKTFVDLEKDAVRQLYERGVRSLISQGGCSVCDADTYFSFRREKSDNRMMAFITRNG